MGHDGKAQLTAEDIMGNVYKLRANTPAEIERRRHVLAAIANSRIEGSLPGREEMEMWTEYIRGDIKAEDLVEVVKKRLIPLIQRASLLRRQMDDDLF